MTIIISQIETTREGIEQTLVNYKGNYYVVSHSTIVSEPETFIFKSNSEGKITDWQEVGGAKHVKLNEVVESMSDYMYRIKK